MQVLMLPADSITFGSRQRTVDENTRQHIEELAKEIEQDGLLHAVTLNKNHELVAGFCRLHAIQHLNKPYKYASTTVAPGFVPCVITHLETERELFRVELMENIRRKSLTPMDEAKAVAKLHKMFQEIAEEAGEDWSELKTGIELDKARGDDRHVKSAQTEVGESLLLAQFENDPDISKASSRKEAVKLAKKKLEKEFLSTLGAMIVKQDSDFQIIEGDCIQEMEKLPANHFNGIVVDPPYGIDAQNFGEQSNASSHEYDDSKDKALSIIYAILKNGLRICKDDAHAYVFCSSYMFDSIIKMLQGMKEVNENCWVPFPTPLIWHKQHIGHMPWPGYFQRRYESIMFLRRGTRPLNKVRSDVFEYPAVRDKIHSAQKPEELLKEILSLSFFPGDIVLDPCAGSGSIFGAAKSYNMRAVGIEMNPHFANICKEKIAGLK